MPFTPLLARLLTSSVEYEGISLKWFSSDDKNFLILITNLFGDAYVFLESDVLAFAPLSSPGEPVTERLRIGERHRADRIPVADLARGDLHLIDPPPPPSPEQEPQPLPPLSDLLTLENVPKNAWIRIYVRQGAGGTYIGHSRVIAGEEAYPLCPPCGPSACRP